MVRLTEPSSVHLDFELVLRLPIESTRLTGSTLKKACVPLHTKLHLV